MASRLASRPARDWAEHQPASLARPERPADLPVLRDLLESQWQQRLRRLTELSLAYHDAEAAAHTGTGARAGRAARRRAAALLRRAVAQRLALAETDQALHRLEHGSFGRCEQCGRRIPASMLARVPQARYCPACGHNASHSHQSGIWVPDPEAPAPARLRRTAEVRQRRRSGPAVKLAR